MFLYCVMILQSISIVRMWCIITVQAKNSKCFFVGIYIFTTFWIDDVYCKNIVREIKTSKIILILQINIIKIYYNKTDFVLMKFIIIGVIELLTLMKSCLCVFVYNSWMSNQNMILLKMPCFVARGRTLAKFNGLNFNTCFMAPSRSTRLILPSKWRSLSKFERTEK